MLDKFTPTVVTPENEGVIKARLKGDSGDGTSGGDMEERVTRLETHMEYVRRDLDDLKQGQVRIADKLDGISTTIGGLATKTQVETENRTTRQTVAIVFVGAVIAGVAAIWAAQANLLAALQAGLTMVSAHR